VQGLFITTARWLITQTHGLPLERHEDRDSKELKRRGRHVIVMYAARKILRQEVYACESSTQALRQASGLKDANKGKITGLLRLVGPNSNQSLVCREVFAKATDRRAKAGGKSGGV
jgi:hypothetical protein